MKTIAATEAKNRFGAVLDDAQREPIVIRKQDRDVAVVLSMPSPRGRGVLPYSPNALSRAVTENLKHFGIPSWRPHDLRRTAASCMTMLKIPRLHVEKVLNHATSDIAEVYDRHDYLDEKRVALERWGNYLESIIAGKEATVVPLPVLARQTA